MTIEKLPVQRLFRPISRIDVYNLNGNPTGYLQRILEQNDLDGNLTRAVYLYIYCSYANLYEDTQDDQSIPIEFDLRKSIDITEDKAISATHYIDENVKCSFGSITCVYSRDPLNALPSRAIDFGFSDNIFRPMMKVPEYVTRTLLGLSGDKKVLIVTIDVDVD